MFVNVAKELEASFSPADLARGRALVRRRRVRVVSLRGAVARVEVRGSDARHYVVVDAGSADRRLFCNCLDFEERGRCGHGWAALLAASVAAAAPAAPAISLAPRAEAPPSAPAR